MKTLPLTAEDLLGTYRTFGAEGPLYKVLPRAGETVVRIVVVESGEELDYSIERALRDPEAE